RCRRSACLRRQIGAPSSSSTIPCSNATAAKPLSCWPGSKIMPPALITRDFVCSPWDGPTGHTFLPLDFALLSAGKSAIKDIDENIDKRTNGYKRHQEALLSAQQVIVSMLNRALAAGPTASYVLMDSWFTPAPLIGEIASLSLDVIGMVKNDNK